MPSHIHIYHEIPGSRNPETGRCKFRCDGGNGCDKVIGEQIYNFDAIKPGELKKRWNTLYLQSVRDNRVLGPYQVKDKQGGDFIARDWYSPDSIAERFSYSQVVWLLRNWLDLEDGRWIPEPTDTGYVGGGKGIAGQAPFRACSEVVAELDMRMSRVKADNPQDFLMLESIYIWGKPEYEIARALNLEWEEVVRRSERAIKYCSGKRQKRSSYKEWCEHRVSAYQSQNAEIHLSVN